MASFFPLGGNASRQNNHRGTSSSTNINQDHHQQQFPPNFYLYRCEDNPQKGFQLWQEYCQNQGENSQHQSQNLYSSDGGMRGSSSGGSRGSVSCQDCGNQAKKECKNMRCRACCKSRGFDCPTHVKSTWVPAAKRRERKHQSYEHQDTQQQQQQMQRLDVSERTNPKRSRDYPSTSGLEVGRFPAEVNTEATFRCVRVSSMDDGEDQYAYQTAVNINGHLFKGFLYDQGPESHYNMSADSLSGGGSGSTTGVHQPNLLTTTAGSGGASPFIDPAMFPSPLNNFMAGTQFFPPPPS